MLKMEIDKKSSNELVLGGKNVSDDVAELADLLNKYAYRVVVLTPDGRTYRVYLARLAIQDDAILLHVETVMMEDT